MIDLCEHCFYDRIRPEFVKWLKWSDEPERCRACHGDSVRVIKECRLNGGMDYQRLLTDIPAASAKEKAAKRMRRPKKLGLD